MTLLESREPTITVELPAGSALDGNRYRIQRVLGQGAFGITYAAEDTRLRRSVAIKELFPPGCVRVGRQVVPRAVDPSAESRFVHLRRRFLDEAANLARFAHPGIVRIYEVFEEHGTAYVVMERLEGRTLGGMLAQRGGRMPVDEAVRITREVGAALTVVHRAGLLHRDLKPDNVLVTDQGRVVLVDFGSARQFAADASCTMTQVVTHGYAPLEQYSSRSTFGPATDVYGLAATLYRAVAGQAPPPPTDRVHGAGFLPLDRIDRRVPASVSAAVTHALSLEASARPQSVTAFLAELDARPPNPPARDRNSRRYSALNSDLVIKRVEEELAKRPWLPVLIAIAAVASVAPLHVVAAITLVVLPSFNALVRTRRHYRRRVKRWHDPVTRPVHFVGEAGRAIGQIGREGATPLVATVVGAALAFAALGYVDHGARPMPAVRAIAAIASVSMIVWLVRRLQRNPRFSSSFGTDLVAPLVEGRRRLSTAGRSAWATAAGLTVLVVAVPRWPLL
jgi:serine/threonine protein kinase